MKTKQEYLIEKTIIIHASVAKVWAALTTPELLSHWMIDTGMTIESEWQVGSPISFSGDLHGLPYKNHGTIIKFDVEKCFEYNFWSTLSLIRDIPENYSLITFTLSDLGETTSLQLTQSNFPLKTIYQHSNFYWNSALYKLKQMLEE